jgi:hypothetical protein
MMELSALPFLDRSPDCAISCQQVIGTVGDGPGSGTEEAVWSGPLIGSFLPEVPEITAVFAEEVDLGASFVLVQNPLGKKKCTFGFLLFTD